MVNKKVLATESMKAGSAVLSINSEHAPAYAMSEKLALSQLALTGTIADAFYESAESQLARAVELANEVDVKFLAHLAVYARRNGKMKDMPALLLAVLSRRDSHLFKKVFPEVIDSGRMLRTFVQMIRSGVSGRRSLGTAPKREIQKWMTAAADSKVINASIGREPSLADVIRLAHPKPKNKTRDALYAMVLDLKGKEESLPPLARDLLAFQSGDSTLLPKVNFQLLTGGRALSKTEWQGIARAASWQTVRMNLNTFQRHGVFEGHGSSEVITHIANRLSDREEIMAAKVMPFQLLAAWKNFKGEGRIREALEEAMEVSIENVPSCEKRVVVMTDISGSMRSPVTGRGHAKASSIQCAEAAALLTAIVARRNGMTKVMPFSDRLYPSFAMRNGMKVFELAHAISRLPSGGTDCSLPLRKLNEDRETADLLIFFSDNESWLDAGAGYKKPAMQAEWERFKQRNPRAQLICVDLAPNRTTQAASGADVLNVGGFSEDIFEVMGDFLSRKDRNKKDLEFLVKTIEEMKLSVSETDENEDAEE